MRWSWLKCIPFNVMPLLPPKLKEVAEEGGLLAESMLILLCLFDHGLILGSDSVVDSAPEGRTANCRAGSDNRGDRDHTTSQGKNCKVHSSCLTCCCCYHCYCL